MDLMPELAVALRRALLEDLTEQESEAVLLSTWAKGRQARTALYISTLRQALERAMPLVLWQQGAWGIATAARNVIGGELTTEADMAHESQLWLFDTVSIPSLVRKRFGLPNEVRTVGRVLLPVQQHTVEGRAGVALGYLFQSASGSQKRRGVPFLRLLPELYPGEFIADPHVNFIAAYRYAQRHQYPVSAPGKGRIFAVGLPD